MSKWKKLQNTKEEWEIYDLLKKGLQPCDSFTKEPIPCPILLHSYYQLFDIAVNLSEEQGKFIFKICSDTPANFNPITDNPPVRNLLKEAEEKISQDGFILVEDRSIFVDGLDRLTDKKVICDKCFGQLRQEDGKYRITAQEIETLKNYRSKVLEKQNKVEEQIGKIRVNDPNLNSWRNLVEITSKKQKEVFSETLKEAVCLQNELDGLSDFQPGEDINKPQTDIDIIFQDAKPEILIIYNEISKNINKQNILEFFDSVKVWNNLKREYFVDDNILSYSTEKTKKRDIIGNILEKIALDCGMEINKQANYKKHFATPKKK